MVKALTKQHISLLFSLYITQFVGLAFFVWLQKHLLQFYEKIRCKLT